MAEIMDCPSAPLADPNARVFGVVQGVDAPRVHYLQSPIPVSDDLLKLNESLHLSVVVRAAAPCAEDLCRHHSQGSCQLATRIVKDLPEVSSAIPKCGLRSSCKWWSEQGVAACHRCPQVATASSNASDLLRQVADDPGTSN